MLEHDLINSQGVWQTKERPGYLGKRKDEMYRYWDSSEGYGKGRWRIVNEAFNKEIFTYEDIIYRVYIPGYEKYFLNRPEEALLITDKYSYGYDKDGISKDQAFDIYALYNKPGIPNQFHHVAFNLALESIGYRFRGTRPIQIREGKPGTPESGQPKGFKWSPGRIPCTIPELIPELHIIGWWNLNSIEDFYQSTKALQIRIW